MMVPRAGLDEQRRTPPARGLAESDRQRRDSMNTSSPVRAPIPPSPQPPRRTRTWLALALAVAVVALLAGGIAALRSRPASDQAAAPGSSSAGSAGAPGSTATAVPSAATPSATQFAAPSPSATASGQGSAGFRFLPLWPFTSVDDATRWQREALPGGHQPWRLDAGRTALTFAATYLGYTEINRVTSTRVAGDEAWIGVAATPPEGTVSTACVLHLARIGAGPASGRPWEVVGSQDTTLTLTAPRYGSVVGSTFGVGGQITGVDESLAVQVRAGGEVLAQVVGIPAGGRDQPWSTTLTVSTGRPGLATVAVATGGHLLRVERFAVTAVRIRAGTSPAPSYPTADAALASLVSNGTYVGSCATAHLGPAVARPVCSVALKQTAGRYLYRLGYWQTDNGFYAVLGRNREGRWVVLDPNLAGADIPQDLGGPIGDGR